MDIPKTSMAMSQSKVATTVNISMMKKAIEQTEEQGNQMAEMIRQTSVQHPGSSVDIKI